MQVFDREITWIDKAPWGDGPWQSEPDKVQWVDKETGLDCLAVRHERSGHWCGYVGVPEEHPDFGKAYDTLNEAEVEVHGGATFSDTCQEDENAEDRGICHIPLPGRPDKVWWFGFDCMRGGDYSPGYDGLVGFKTMSSWPITYKNLGYVVEECRGLARQLKRREKSVARPE